MIAKDLDLDSLCATFEICPRFLPVLEKQRESIVPLVEGSDVTLNRDFRFVARYNSHLAPSLRLIFFNPNFPLPSCLRFSQSDTQNTHVTPQEILVNEAFTAQITDIFKALSIIERGIQHRYKLSGYLEHRLLQAELSSFIVIRGAHAYSTLRNSQRWNASPL
ncbi:uncharacterized protein TERG_12450 [Trichophyton rubrum CBS 118892]|uniref:Uncharacterized protein n=1 Tax=Trichophyton rubrum (strain ATCC MYA-4607 / CBS 118892) TaxID=559305 RepID=A0A080WL91_TRIRC|nr:uncharacterized protein TERG_12450 [Trichophyton rubrum CBS 118892]KFL62464.1 hypothetical protein TERG_12450 [Trichophyton rubrum CBS 118892]